MANMGKAIEARFHDTAKAVQKLRARGGKIVFVRFPNNGELKALEDRLNSARARLGNGCSRKPTFPGFTSKTIRSWPASPVPSGRIFPPATPSNSPSDSFRIFARH